MAGFRRVAVLGAGKSGVAAARLAATLSEEVWILDGGSPDAAPLEEEGFQVVSGPAADRLPVTPDLVVQSPGIDPRRPIVTQFLERNIPVIGEVEFAFRQFGGSVIAITGTNGKTTTTELISRVFESAGMPAPCAGNYGVPFSEVVLRSPQPAWVALEVSSFQLELIESLRPRVSVWLNFAADHLDRYDSLEDYRAAKLRIFDFQTAEDLAVIQADDLPLIDGLPMRQRSFSAFSAADLTFRDGCIVDTEGMVFPYGETRLRGTHNAENVMATLAVAAEFEIPPETVLEALREYVPPVHRCELVGEVDGHEFINDSKATNLHALKSSLRGQPEPVVLIAGGKEKGLDYGELREVVAAKVSHAVLLGEIREQIASSWEGIVSVTVVESLKEAVEESLRRCRPNQVILFSPGTSSFDMFRSYEARGDAFKKAIQDL